MATSFELPCCHPLYSFHMHIVQCVEDARWQEWASAYVCDEEQGEHCLSIAAPLQEHADIWYAFACNDTYINSVSHIKHLSKCIKYVRQYIIKCRAHVPMGPNFIASTLCYVSVVHIQQAIICSINHFFIDLIFPFYFYWISLCIFLAYATK